MLGPCFAHAQCITLIPCINQYTILFYMVIVSFQRCSYLTTCALAGRCPDMFTKLLVVSHQLYVCASLWTTTCRPKFNSLGLVFFNSMKTCVSLCPVFQLLWPFDKLACPANCPPVFCEDRVTTTTWVRVLGFLVRSILTSGTGLGPISEAHITSAHSIT